MKVRRLLVIMVACVLAIGGVWLWGRDNSSAQAEEASRLCLTADCDSVEREVDPCMFGYILTPNYDVPDSRMSLLGRVLNRESIPVQNFQAIGDMDGSYYTDCEGSVKERHLEAYRRAKACGCDWYMLMGMNPSWATASGNPVDTSENKPLKTEKQLANFKQYMKDVLQYMKDNGAKPDFCDLTNEYWTGTEETYRVVWEALREVYPDAIPAVGPGGVGYDGIKDFYIPYASENDITVEGPSWHAYWKDDRYASFSQLKQWRDNIKQWQDKYPKANGKYIIWEENNAGSTNPTDWTRSMSNVIRTGVDKNIKGCLESTNWNGMSDLLTTNVKEQNPAARRPIWWVYYMFSQMSGDYVKVTTNGDEAFTGAVSVDREKKQVKTVLANNEADGKIDVKLNQIPFDCGNVSIDLYKITNTENDGLEYQKTIQPARNENRNLEFSIADAGANETWMAVVKTPEAEPAFFVPLTPDDGEVVTSKPTFTWSKSQGAESYDLLVSQNKDLSSPVIEKKDLTERTYKAETALKEGSTYYWSVRAKNKNGSCLVSHDVKYSFLVGKSSEVPGQFGPYLPSVGAKNEAVRPTLKWSTAYNADSYRVVVSKNEDLSDPVVDVDGITKVQGTGQFGEKSQGYYKLTTALEYKTKYYWRVYAENAKGERPMNGVSHWFVTKGQGTTPEAFALTYPVNRAENVSGRAELTWEEATNAFFYQLEISDCEDMSNIVLKRTHMIYNKYRLEQNALKPGKTYYWRVTAMNKTRKMLTECSNGVQSFTMEKTPSAPLLYAEQPGEQDGTVTLWYRGSEKAKYYVIYYGKESGQYTKKISGITETSHTVTGLKGGQTYYFAVKAANYDGESSVWNERSVVPNGTGENWKESDEEESDFVPVLTPEPTDVPTPVPTAKPTDVPTPTWMPTPLPTDRNKPSPTPDTNNKKIVVAKVSGVKAKVKGKTATISWKKVKGAAGYRILYSTDKKFKKGVKKANTKTTRYVIKKLKKGKKYFVKVCAFAKDAAGKKVTGKYSSVKKVTGR